MAAGKNSQLCAALFLLAGVMAARAADQPQPADEKFTFVAIHQAPKPARRDPLLLVHEELGKHNHSNTLFSIRADYNEFAYNDTFVRRQEACVVGIRASFSF